MQNVWHLTMQFIHLPPSALHTAAQASNRLTCFHFVGSWCWLE